MNSHFNQQNNVIQYNGQKNNDDGFDNINNYFNENVKYINMRWKKMNDSLEEIRNDLKELERMFNKYEYNQNFLEGAKYLRNKEQLILQEMNSLYSKVSDVYKR
tara:strand:+ start:161 stop:472 length:312 start_codon:yes stop_codon:yes gene_type:complete